MDIHHHISGGLIVKLVGILRAVRQKEPYIYSYVTLKHSLRSIGAWLIPFFPRSARMSPVYYGVSYLFHIFLFLVPLFLASHIVLINEAFQISWPALNDQAADWLTVGVMAALIFLPFAGSRYRKSDISPVPWIMC